MNVGTIAKKPIVDKFVVVCAVLKLEVRFPQAKIKRSEARRPEETVTAMATALEILEVDIISELANEINRP